MNGVLQHPLRVTGRLAWLGSELLLAALNFVREVLLRPERSALDARGRWLQHSCRRALRIFGTEMRVVGPIPGTGLLVSNHLSYLDILVLSSLTPCLFVAKREVKYWPVFGWFAGLAGTVFVNREKRSQVGQTTEQMEAVLERGALLVLFPEGTSSGGQTVLGFKSSLLEAAIRQPHAMTAASIEYELDDGDATEEVCYWKDMTLLPHLINLLSKRRIRVFVGFSRLQQGSRNRKELARQLHSEVLTLKARRSIRTAPATV